MPGKYETNFVKHVKAFNKKTRFMFVTCNSFILLDEKEQKDLDSKDSKQAYFC